MSVCRYRETITKELSRICNLPTTPVWRQAKDMLKEEGIELSLDAPQAPEPAKADADVQVGSAPSPFQYAHYVLHLAHIMHLAQMMHLAHMLHWSSSLSASQGKSSMLWRQSIQSAGNRTKNGTCWCSDGFSNIMIAMMVSSLLQSQHGLAQPISTAPD